MATKRTVKKEEVVEKKAKLNPSVWSLPLNEDLVAQVLLVMRSNARQANAHAKTRADVRGGGKKPWKQKGTGRARAGSIRSPLWVKGGVTFVPNKRVWDRKINKKMRKLAIAMLLSQRLRDEALSFVNFENKEIINIRKSILPEILSGKFNLVISEDDNVVKGLRNITKVNVVNPKEVNALNIALAKNVLVDEKSINVIESNLINEK